MRSRVSDRSFYLTAITSLAEDIAAAKTRASADDVHAIAQLRRPILSGRFAPRAALLVPALAVPGVALLLFALAH